MLDLNQFPARLLIVPIVQSNFNEFDGISWERRLFDTLTKAYAWVKQ
jgi:hypothetical protein